MNIALGLQCTKPVYYSIASNSFFPRVDTLECPIINGVALYTYTRTVQLIASYDRNTTFQRHIVSVQLINSFACVNKLFSNRIIDRSSRVYSKRIFLLYNAHQASKGHVGRNYHSNCTGCQSILVPCKFQPMFMIPIR